MRRLALAIALACILSGVARAGEIPSTGAVAPPPPSRMATTGEIHSTGEIPTTEATETQASSTLLTIILTLISIVP
jgi:hypothetical protein